MGKGRTYRARKRRNACEQAAKAKPKGRVARDKEWIELRRWCKDRQMPRSKLTLAYFPDTFRGMMATKDICSGDDIVRIPEHLLVTASKARRDLATASSCPVKADVRPLSEHQALTYWLYVEHKRGKKSSWACYLNSLPQDFASVPLFVLSGESPGREIAASTEVAQWLLEHLPRGVRRKVAEQMARLFVDWSCTHTHAATAGGAYSVDDWRCYVWAWLAVNTRCIHLGQDIGSRDTIALAPFLDLLNHGKEAKVTTYFDLVSRQFVIKTLTPYKRGREVFISYGPHDNSFMLAEYGFVIAENPFQTLELDHQVYAWIAAVKSRLRPATPGKPATVQPSDIDEMIRTLKRHGLWGDFALSPEDRDIPYRLQAALRLLISHAAVHQQGIYSKGAIVRWERWRRGEPDYSNNDPDNNDCAIRNWVKTACQTIADTSAKMISNIDAYRCAQDMKQCYNVDFPAQCLCTIWKEIDVIARSFTEI